MKGDNPTWCTCCQKLQSLKVKDWLYSVMYGTLSHKTCLENRLSFACSDICVLATEPNKQTEQINIFCSDSETIHQRDYLLLT